MVRVLLLLMLSAPIWAEEKCCQAAADGPVCFNDNRPFDHLPLPDCPETLQITFLLYTRSNRDNGQAISRTTVPPAFQENKRTALIVHGWLGEGRNYWMDDLRRAILDRVDWNVIQVGWPEASQNIWYPQSASDTRAVGTEIGIRIRNMVVSAGARRQDFWCMGHSLGGHVCGHAGKRFKWGRITGLDPAGPLFDTYDINCGLTPNDGDLVDVIHTHGKDGVILNLGTLRPLGDVDFYPNGGGVQPGCVINYANWRPYKSGANPFDLNPVCSHFRAIDYIEEAFKSTSCRFNARSRCSNERDIPNSCTSCGGVCQAIGLDTENFPGRGRFFLETNDDEPFCKN